MNLNMNMNLFGGPQILAVLIQQMSLSQNLLSQIPSYMMLFHTSHKSFLRLGPLLYFCTQIMIFLLYMIGFLVCPFALSILRDQKLSLVRLIHQLQMDLLIHMVFWHKFEWEINNLKPPTKWEIKIWNHPTIKNEKNISIILFMIVY